MGSEGPRAALALAAVLLAGCHGPPLLSRVTPVGPGPSVPAESAPAESAPAPRVAPADVLRAPTYGAQEASERIEAERLADAVEEGLRRRRSWQNGPLPAPELMEEARGMAETWRVGREGPGSIPIDLCLVIEALRRAAKK